MEFRNYEVVEEVEFYRDLLIEYLKERNMLIRELKQNNMMIEQYEEKNIALVKEIDKLNNEIGSLKTTLAVMNAF